MYKNNNYNAAHDIYKHILLEGGVTYWTTITEQYTGYLVAVKQHELIISLFDADVIGKIQRYILANIAQGQALGFWEHEGHIYCDVVKHFETERTAIYNGKLQNQIAIWDIEHNRSILLTQTHGT